MTYVNVGAYTDNKRVPTKTELKRIAKETPWLLRFDQTSIIMDYSLPRNISVETLPLGCILSVVGPDPYTNRRWYASITLSSNGKLRVS